MPWPFSAVPVVKPVSIEDETVVLSLKYSIYKEKMEKPEYQQVAEKIISDFLGHPCKIRCICEPENNHLVKAAYETGSPGYQCGGKMNRNMIQQAQQLQARLAKAQAELANMTLEVSSGGGVVKVTVDGQQNIKSIKIAKEVVNPEDVEMLEDLVLTAVKEAIAKSQEAASKQLGGLTGGLKIPGLNVGKKEII